MEDILYINSVADYCNLRNYEVLHPLISIVDFDKVNKEGHSRKRYSAFHFNCYAIFLKDAEGCKMIYGGKPYDYDEGTLVFLKPNQIIELSGYNPNHVPKGYAILFHPDLLSGTDLSKKIHNYSFFSYASNEALHISAKERKMILDLIGKVQFELNQSFDKHSKKLIVSNLELFLDYCTRFYDRQFLTRDSENHNILERFDKSLKEYLNSGKAEKIGTPSVGYFANELHLSSNYFGDLIKRKTGKSALEYIQMELIKMAKEKIFDSQKSISEVAYELGFKYPHHFSRLFKNKVGYSPKEFRNLN